MKKTAFLTLVAAVAALSAGRADAQAPVYSFEVIAPGGGPPGPDGFFGLGATVSQEPTVGVTHLENSMNYTAGNGGFVGVRTEIVPATLNNPPGVTHVLLDMFIPSPMPVGLTFADMGVIALAAVGVFERQDEVMRLGLLRGGGFVDERNRGIDEAGGDLRALHP